MVMKNILMWIYKNVCFKKATSHIIQVANLDLMVRPETFGILFYFIGRHNLVNAMYSRALYFILIIYVQMKGSCNVVFICDSTGSHPI